MVIKTKKLSPVDFCIMVLWINGMTTGEIFRYFAMEKGKSKAAIRGVVNRIQTRRERMTREDRQKFLDAMKEARIDGGKLEAQFFIARPMDTDAMAYGPPARKPKPQKIAPPEFDLSTRAGRKAAKMHERKEKEEQESKEAELELRSLGRAPRGLSMVPLEHLYYSRALADDPKLSRGTLDKSTNENMRYFSGQLLRARLEASLLSGVKSQSYEIMGVSSSKGFSITFRMMQARHELESIRKMVGEVGFRRMELMLRYDQFIWIGVPDEADALEEVRCSLDVVSVYDGTMNEDDFLIRWNFLPPNFNVRNRSESIEIASAAREMVERAAREVG